MSTETTYKTSTRELGEPSFDRSSLIRVAIVEDDPAARSAISNAVMDHPQLHLLWVAQTLDQAYGFAQHQSADVYLVDLSLPDGRGEEFIEWIQNQQWAANVMVLTMMGDRESVLRSFKAGAKAYVLKDSPLALLAKQIVDLHRGGSPMSAHAARILLQTFQSANPQHAPARQPGSNEAWRDDANAGSAAAITTALSQRELQVLRLLYKGLSYQDIAQNMHLSYHTVTTYLRRIYRKLGVKSRSAAVFQAQSCGII